MFALTSSMHFGRLKQSVLLLQTILGYFRDRGLFAGHGQAVAVFHVVIFGLN